ncbi:ATPase AAA [Halorubrum coriense DSM 10284]|uniref:ATPase AAA n=1 Tax=Halorubrum coriense DSM 10284 TaxID=1227466 RepID=M0ERB0_9EURY|nr:AAA family ATPase [Halorubrum coriense]ELZ48959.1 ATPase AAA [Halorubrum coriense DSM 10284]QRG24150.1 Orc1 replication protein [Halorubrum virus Humcor1]
MIRRPEVFDDETPPPDLRHREAQVQELIRLLHRARTDHDQGALLAGPSGVGKTALGRTVLEEFSHEFGTHWTWIQALGTTTGELFREAIRGAGGSVVDNAPNDTLPRKLRETLVGDDLLVLLDEADDIAGTGAVGQLIAVPGVEVVVICHEPDDWLARAEADTRQYLHSGRIELRRFGVDELADILADRARVGLVDGAVSRKQLETIADDVAGVAREGIQTLRAAAEIANECEHTSIHDTDVDDAYERARASIREANLQSLPFHHRVLYELIREGSQVTGRKLHAQYEEIKEGVYANREYTPISRRSRRNKLNKLRAYDLVERERLDHRWLYAPTDSELIAPLTGIDEQQIQLKCMTK